LYISFIFNKKKTAGLQMPPGGVVVFWKGPVD
jgi:hypothetical protein